MIQLISPQAGLTYADADLTRRELLRIGLATSFASFLPSKATATEMESSQTLLREQSQAIRDAFENYPLIDEGEGRGVFIITRYGCPHTARLFSDHPVAPAGLRTSYVVIPSNEAPNQAYLHLFADPSTANFARFMQGGYNGLPRSLSGSQRAAFTGYVERFRGIERALAAARLRPVAPMFFWETAGSLEYFRGYDPELIAYIQQLDEGAARSTGRAPW